MKQQILLLLLVVISLLGIMDASYITYEELSGQVPACAPPFQCGTVLNSQWSHIAGIPISIFGMGFYAMMFLLAILNVAEVNIPIPVTKTVRRSIYLLATLGFGFSLYLVTLMQFVLQAWCLYCLISAVSSTSLLVVAMFLKRTEKLTAVSA